MAEASLVRIRAFQLIIKEARAAHDVVTSIYILHILFIVFFVMFIMCAAT